jgi:hypothetical protein
MSTPQDVRDPAREILFRMAAMSLAIRDQQALETSIRVALHELKHGRHDQAARVLRAAVDLPGSARAAVETGK